jgi:hypothetical protein
MFNERDRGMARFFGKFAKNRYNKEAAARGLDGEFILGMALALLSVVVLWWTPLLFPFRIFTTSAHEVSHALAALLTGNGVKEIQLYWNGGGVTYITGVDTTFESIIVYSAGYLGSVIFGGTLLLLAKSPSTRRKALYGVTFGLIVVTVFYIRDFQSFILVAIVAGLAGLVAYKGHNLLVQFSIYVLALLSCLYSLMDLFWLFTATANPFHMGFNDAIGLERATSIPSVVWALVWGVVGVFIMFQFVIRAIRRGSASDPSAPSRGSGTSPSPFDRYDDYLSKK